MKLVLVQTPAQAKRIAEILGEGWRVEPCYGMVRDFPADEPGIDMDRDFRPMFTVLSGKANLVRRLMRAIRESEAVYVATPSNRNGELMAWHVLDLSSDAKAKPIYRVLLPMLTSEAVQAAVAAPQLLNTNHAEAALTERIIDRIITYALAIPTPGGKSVLNRWGFIALFQMMQRERRNREFGDEKTWNAVVDFELDGEQFEAQVLNTRGTTLELHTPEQVAQLEALLNKAQFWVDKRGQGIRADLPPAPLRLGDVLALAHAEIGLTPERTLSLAALLYEAGWINALTAKTARVDEDVMASTRDYICQQYGMDHLPTDDGDEERLYSCAYPIDAQRLPEEKSGDSAALYRLIWHHFIASQMASAQYRVRAARILAGAGREKPYPLELRVAWEERVFAGWQCAFDTADDSAALPPKLQAGMELQPIEVRMIENTDLVSHWRRWELISDLIEHDAAPMTAVEAVQQLVDAGYVVEQEGELIPTDTGIAVFKHLTTTFPELLTDQATLLWQSTFHRIGRGELTRGDVLDVFYSDFYDVCQAVKRASKQNTTTHRPIILRPAEEE